MKKIPLTQGKFALVDDADFERVNQHKWYAHNQRGCWYAARHTRLPDKPGVIYLHRAILDPARGLDVNHKNGDGLDDRRENIEVCTRAQNLRSYKRKTPGATSEFRGVCWDANRELWMAQIKYRGKKPYIGRFSNPEDAAKAYDAKARKLGWPEHGLNFPLK